jgi:hypothetical protein
MMLSDENQCREEQDDRRNKIEHQQNESKLFESAIAIDDDYFVQKTTSINQSTLADFENNEEKSGRNKNCKSYSRLIITSSTYVGMRGGKSVTSGNVCSC